MLGGQVRVRDRRADRVAVAAARHAADERVADADGLRAERDRAGVGEGQAAEPPLGLPAAASASRPTNGALVELHREPEPRLERRVLGGDVRAPDAVALLEAERVDRLVAARDEPVLAARLPELVPEPGAELGRAVELPAELADVGDADGEARDRPDRELPGRHVREGVVRERR